MGKLKVDANFWYKCECGKRFASVTGIMGCKESHKKEN